MTEADLGKATIAYEDPDGETVEETVDNEYVAYFQDHWMVKTGESDDGQDTVRRIPATRVYYVERNVEQFEEEVKTLRNQVQSLASDISGEVKTLRDRIESVAGGVQQQRGGGAGSDGGAESEAEPIEITVGEGVERSGSDPDDVVNEGDGREGENEAESDEGEGSDGDEDVDRSL